MHGNTTDLGETMGVRSTTTTASLALLLCVSLTSCTADEPTQEHVDTAPLELERAADALSVTVLRPGAERAFARKGHPVAAPLTCTPAGSAAPSDTPSAGQAADHNDDEGPQARRGSLTVLCTGRSRDGEELRFEGRLLREALAGRETGDDSLRGAFTGMAGEEEVFTMDCFQCSPVNAGPAGSGAGPEANGAGTG